MTEDTIEITFDEALGIMQTLEWMRLVLSVEGKLPPKDGALMTMYEGVMMALHNKVDDHIDDMFLKAEPFDPEELIE